MVRCMRYPALLACLIAGNAAQAQDEPPPVRWPVLAQSARDAAGFAPRGWAVEASRSGDIDADGIADLVAILHQRSPGNVLRNDQTITNGLDTNPRLLIVALGRRGGSYRLLHANHTLIPRWTESNLEDPLGALDDFVVGRGRFVVPLHLFASSGGWGSFERSFKFRVDGKRCVLIGYDERYQQRNTGEATITSINYVTGAREVTTVTATDDTPARTRRDRLPRRPLLTIDDVGDGMAFSAK